MASKFDDDDSQPVAAPKSKFDDDDSAPIAEAAPAEDEGGLLDALAVPLYERIPGVLREVDKVTQAPVRAGMAAGQRGESIIGAAADQFVAGLPKLQYKDWPKAGEYLPTTPDSFEPVSTEMARRFGAPEDIAQTIGSVHGTAMDFLADPLMLVPGKGATKVLGAAREGVLKSFKMAENAAAPIVMGVGRVATMGTLPYQKAVKAARNLSAGELIAPGNKSFGAMAEAMAEVKQLRDALNANKVTVPGSREVATQVAQEITAARGRSLSHPHADELLTKLDNLVNEQVIREVEIPIPDEVIAARVNEIAHAIEEMRPQLLANKGMTSSPNLPTEMLIEHKAQWENYAKIGNDLAEYQEYLWKRQNPKSFPDLKPLTEKRMVPDTKPRDLTLNELDDVVGMLDEGLYTNAGNAKELRRVWGPALARSRGALDEIMQSVPEGKVFKAAKSHQEDLMTAAKGRSKLWEVGAVYSTAERLQDHNADLASLAYAALPMAVLPRTYMRLMGVLKVPGSIAKTLLLAHESGKAAKMRDAIRDVADKNPLLAERIIRGTLLMSMKPDQNVTEEEAQTLGKTRIFDPEQVLAEKMRIENDRTMPTGKKARMLSDINKNGYITMDGAQPMPEPEMPANPVIETRGLPELMRMLDR